MNYFFIFIVCLLAYPERMTGENTVKTFIIDHPRAAEKYIVHAAIEGPESRVFYRGNVTLKHGHDGKHARAPAQEVAKGRLRRGADALPVEHLQPAGGG